MNSDDRKVFGLRLAALRARAGCTQSEIASCLKKERGKRPKGQDFVSKVEKGRLLLDDEDVRLIAEKLPVLAKERGHSWDPAVAQPFDLTFWEADPGKNAPRLLQRAAATYRAVLYLEQLEKKADLFNSAQEQSCYFLNIKYTQFDNGLERLRDCVADWLSNLKGVARQAVSTGHFQPEYDAIRWTSLVAGKRVTYPFPFILSPSRMYQWFVVPYGTHRRIGIALNRANPNLKEWKRIFPVGSHPQSSPITDRWFAKVLQDVRSSKAKAYGVEGWMQQELVQLLAGKVASDLELQTLPEFSRALTSKDLDPKSRIPTALTKDEPFDIYIYDLADHSAISEGIEGNSQYEHLVTITFPHGLELPVGVGFTISMVPAVLPERPRSFGNGPPSHPWQELLTLLKAKVFTDSVLPGVDVTYTKALSGIGIDIELPSNQKPSRKDHA